MRSWLALSQCQRDDLTKDIMTLCSIFGDEIHTLEDNHMIDDPMRSCKLLVSLEIEKMTGPALDEGVRCRM